MAAYSPLHNGYHMGLIQPVFSAKCRQVYDRAYGLPIWANEPIIRFDIVPFANTISVCPAFVGFQLALSHCQPVHRSETQVMLPTEIKKIGNDNFSTVRVNEALPDLSK